MKSLLTLFLFDSLSKYMGYRLRGKVMRWPLDERTHRNGWGKDNQLSRTMLERFWSHLLCRFATNRSR